MKKGGSPTVLPPYILKTLYPNPKTLTFLPLQHDGFLLAAIDLDGERCRSVLFPSLL